MKNNLLKLITTFGLSFLAAIFMYQIPNTGNAQEASAPISPYCSAAPLLDINTGIPSSEKVIAGQTIYYEIQQPDATKYKVGDIVGKKADGTRADAITADQTLYNYRIFYWDKVSDVTTGYKPLATGIIRTNEDKVDEFNIPATAAAGDYQLRVVIDDLVRYSDSLGPGNPCLNHQVDDTDFTIAGTKGIIVAPTAKEVKIGTTTTINLKFYGLGGQQFKVFLNDETNPSLGFATIPATDGQIVPITWNTTGKTEGIYTITVKAYPGVAGTDNNKTTESITLSTSGPPPPGPGGTTSAPTFSILKLNSFNIKNLLNSCKSKPDLGGILCIVEAVISWLLDISMVISFIMILYSAAIYLTSFGEESKAELAKKTLLWSVIGVIVILAAKAIMLIIQKGINNPNSLGL